MSAQCLVCGAEVRQDHHGRLHRHRPVATCSGSRKRPDDADLAGPVVEALSVDEFLDLGDEVKAQLLRAAKAASGYKGAEIQDKTGLNQERISQAIHARYPVSQNTWSILWTFFAGFASVRISPGRVWVGWRVDGIQPREDETI